MNRRHVAIAVLLAAGCGIGDVANPGLAPANQPGGSSGTTTPPVPDDCVQPACQTFPLPPSPHAVRLSSPQWEITIRDLLRLDTAPGSSINFPPDPVSSPERFGSEAGDLIVTTQHWAAYQKASEDLAALIGDDASALAKLLPDAAKSGDQTARIAAFVTDFLPRAYRRAVTAKETSDVIATAESAASGVSTGDPFVVRVKWILTAVLQSPKFLYRISFGEGAPKDGRARLSGYEIASKLSYGLWGTMPDPVLMEEAKAGKLATPAGVAEVAARMISDPRGAAAIGRFHDQLYLVDHFTDVKNRPNDLHPNYYPELALDAQEDIRRTVQELVVKQGLGVKALHTSPIAFVNNRLAPIYGIDPSTVPELATSGPDRFIQIAMDPAKRKGILMHPGWLFYEASPKDPSPIHRGAYVARHVICTPLGSPPPGAAGADPSKNTQPTNRLRVEDTTKGCGDGCHGGKSGVINPLGFAFEGFDSIGQLRPLDNGMPVDTRGAIELLGPFDSAPPLFDTISTNPRAHACYAAHWSAYLNGTSIVDVTPRYLSPAVKKSLSGASVRDIIVELVQTDAFLTVSR